MRYNKHILGIANENWHGKCKFSWMLHGAVNTLPFRCDKFVKKSDCMECVNLFLPFFSFVCWGAVHKNSWHELSKKKKKRKERESPHFSATVSLFPGGNRASNIRINHTRGCVQRTLEKQHKFPDRRTNEDIKHDRRWKIAVSLLSLSIQLDVEPWLMISKAHKDVSRQLKQMLAVCACDDRRVSGLTAVDLPIVPFTSHLRRAPVSACVFELRSNPVQSSVYIHAVRLLSSLSLETAWGGAIKQMLPEAKAPQRLSFLSLSVSSSLSTRATWPDLKS